MRVLAVTSQLPTGGRSLTMAPLVRQIDSLRDAGIEITIMQVTGVPKLKYLQAVPRVRRLAADVDLIHAHYGFCGWLALMSSDKPVVLSLMGSDLLGSPDRAGKIGPASRLEVRSTLRLAPKVDAVIVKSPEMARVLKGVTAHVIPNGVDMDAFRPRPKDQARTALGWELDVPTVLFPGNPEHPRKGYPLALAMKERAQERLGREIRMVALRGVPPEEVPTYMNACDAMVMTSLIEGSPNVVKEAMASDLPVVAVPVGDVPDLLEGVQGSLVCPRDPDDLAEALAGVLREPSVVSGRAAAEEKGLDLATVARRIIAVYDQVLGRTRDRRSTVPDLIA